MKERSLILSGDDVRAVIDGRKTQVRQVVKTRYGYMVLGRGHDERHNHGRISIPCPLGDVGDRLYVKESWCRAHPDAYDAGPECSTGRPLGPCCYHDEPSLREFCYYAATDPDTVSINDDRSPWRSPATMPRWASRLTLEAVEVRVQRLQDIDESDILAEGITVDRVAKMTGTPWGDMPTLYDAWRVTWDHANAKRAPWTSNPWVWALTFRRVP